MPIIKHSDGKTEYKLERRLAQPTHPFARASNRQRKLLRFFGVSFSEDISVGAAGWEIARIMSSEDCRDRWRRYLFITKDFDSDTDSLKPFDLAVIQTVRIPEDWSSSDAFREYRDELVGDILRDGSPFDRPQPAVSFAKRTFMFTGKFVFGTREACQAAVLSRGGSAPDQKSVSQLINYLVIGVEGSKAWSHGKYGNKIEGAIIARREYGSPAIISEDHWVSALKAV
jgi:hypothetical protein